MRLCAECHGQTTRSANLNNLIVCSGCRSRYEGELVGYCLSCAADTTDKVVPAPSRDVTLLCADCMDSPLVITNEDLYDAGRMALLYLSHHHGLVFSRDLLDHQNLRAMHYPNIPTYPRTRPRNSLGVPHAASSEHFFDGRDLEDKTMDDWRKNKHLNEVLGEIPLVFFEENASPQYDRDGIVPRLGNTVFLENSQNQGCIKHVEILRGLPFTRTVGTLVHELIHCYIFLWRYANRRGHLHSANCYGSAGGDLEEGICHAFSTIFWNDLKSGNFIIPFRLAHRWKSSENLEKVCDKWITKNQEGYFSREIGSCRSALGSTYSDGKSLIQFFALYSTLDNHRVDGFRQNRQFHNL